jgi:hypothetical protein
MFKNKILVKATRSPPASFFLLPLSLASSSSTTDPPLSVELEVLSWKLSRKWRLACIVQPLEVLVVYQVRSSFKSLYKLRIYNMFRSFTRFACSFWCRNLNRIRSIVLFQSLLNLIPPYEWAKFRSCKYILILEIRPGGWTGAVVLE